MAHSMNDSNSETCSSFREKFITRRLRNVETVPKSCNLRAILANGWFPGCKCVCVSSWKLNNQHTEKTFPDEELWSRLVNAEWCPERSQVFHLQSSEWRAQTHPNCQSSHFPVILKWLPSCHSYQPRARPTNLWSDQQRLRSLCCGSSDE